MVNFITGVHGSGKTGYLIEKVLASEDGRGAMLIVPRQITFLTDERLLNTLGAVRASEIEVLSFKRLCDSVMKGIAGVAKKPLRDGVNTIVMLRVLNELKDVLKVYGGAPDLVLAGQLLSEIRRFKTGCVTAEDIRSAKTAGAGKLNDKLDDLADIFERYNAAVSKDYFDENDLLDEIYRILRSESFFDGKIVAFDGFSSYTKQQMRLISLAEKSAKDVYITVSSDNIDGRSIASPFSYVNNFVKRLKRVIKDEIGETEFNVISMEKENSGFSPYKSKDIGVLAENIFRRDSKIPASKDGVRLFSAGSIDSECDFVAREIKKLLRKGEFRCRDIAVSFRNFDTYPVRLANSFRKYDVPFFEDRRQPIANSPLIILVSALIELSVPKRFSDDAIFKYLKSGLAGFSEEEISKLENYSFTWSLKGSDFLSPFSKNPVGILKQDLNEKEEAALNELNGIRERAVRPLESFVETVKNASGKEICAAIYDFLVENGIDSALKEYALSLENANNKALAREQGEVWDALMELLDDIAVSIGDEHAETKMFFELFTLAVQSKTLGRLPSHFDEVTLCSFDRLVNYMPKVLFSVGCNDGVFPSYGSSDSLFSEIERQLLLEKQCSLNIVDDETDNVIYEHFLMYHAVSSATEKLFLTCADMDTKGHSMQPSDLFSMIKRCLTGLDFEPEENTLENMAQSESSAYEYYLRHFNENTSEIKSLELYFSTREGYAGRTELMKRMIAGEPFRIKDKSVASGLFGERMLLSASKVEDYESCPFRYFCNFGLKAKEREKAKFDTRNIGTAAHEVLEKLFKEYRKEFFTEENERFLNDEIEELLDNYLRKKISEDDQTKRFLYLHFRVKKMLSVTLKRIIKQFSLTPFVPVEFEKIIGGDSDIPAVKIPLEDGYIEITGKIDRIDEARIDDSVFINIVDYKTSKRKEFMLSDVLEGINLQMVIYLMAISEGGFNGEKVRPAGVLYSIINGEPVKGEDAKKGNAGKSFYENKTSGMLLDDVGSYFESGADKVFPVKNSYTSDDFELLSKKVKKIIAEMGEKLHNGEIPALSYVKGKGKQQITPCNWCAYKSVCAKSEHGKENVRRIKERNFAETLESLREEAENA